MAEQPVAAAAEALLDLGTDPHVDPPPKKKRRQYSKEFKEEVVYAVNSGMYSKYAAAKHFGVAETNVTDWCNGKAMKNTGKARLLTDGEEELLVDMVKIMALTADGIGMQGLREEVKYLLRHDDERTADFGPDGLPSKFPIISNSSYKFVTPSSLFTVPSCFPSPFSPIKVNEPNEQEKRPGNVKSDNIVTIK